MRFVWLVLGVASLGAGIVGIFLPLVPTVPFLLLAAISFSRSSERLHHWIINHQIYGPPIRKWQESGAISQQAKIFATLSLFAGLGISFTLGFAAWIIATQAAVFVGVLLFIWTRPAG